MTATRKVDGGKYTPKTINWLLAGVLRKIRSTNNNSHFLNFMDTKNVDFKEFRAVLDCLLRQTRSEGIGANPKQFLLSKTKRKAFSGRKECSEVIHQNHYYDLFSS